MTAKTEGFVVKEYLKMNKKGMLILEKIVAMLPNIILFLVVAGVIGALVYMFLPKEKESPELKDLNRIAKEIEQLEKYDKNFLVPVGGKDYELVLFEKESDDSPPICNKKSCICLFDIRDNEFVLNDCKLFDDIGKKSEGGRYFVTSQITVKDKSEIAIGRDGDAISIIS